MVNTRVISENIQDEARTSYKARKKKYSNMMGVCQRGTGANLKLQWPKLKQFEQYNMKGSIGCNPNYRTDIRESILI